jgi:lysozyme
MSANLRAFLALIRWCEGTAGPDGYRTIVGGDKFDSFDDHPNIKKSGRFANGVEWESTAAGAYQFLIRTWRGAQKALGLPDLRLVLGHVHRQFNELLD